ncbi:hypothetical protein JCM6882_000838 [Rhodosporidiobolus microsporus]
MAPMSHSTWRVVRTVAVASLAGFCFGYDTGSVGALTTMDSFYAEFGHISETLRGVIVAIILLPSAMSGVFAGNISDRLSRKRAIALGGYIFCTGQAISCVTFKHLGILAMGRIIAGLGEGVFLGTLNTYVAEISPKHLRGRMMLMTQTFICIGVTAGFFVCYGSAKILHPSSLAWRLPFAISSFVALVMSILAPFLPYSPRWLLLHNRRAEAEAVLEKLVGTGPAAEIEKRELLAVSDQQMAAKTTGGSKRAAFKQIWAPDVRWRTSLGAAVNAFQMLTGVDLILFYAPLLFTQAGLDPDSASFIASGVTGIVLIVSTFITATFIDRVGRRPIYIGGGMLVSITLFVIGSMYASGAAKTEAGKWTVIVFIFLFVFTFGTTMASATRLYSSEIQPSRTRAAASSFSQATNQITNFAVAVSGPVFLEKSDYGPYMCYGALTAFGMVLAFFFMIETKGHSLEAIDDLFSSTSIPLAVPLPDFLVSRSSPLANARLAVTSKVKEHRQRRESRANSQSLGVGVDGIDGIRLRRPSRHGSSALAKAEGGGVDDKEVIHEEGEGSLSDPRIAFRREMAAAHSLGKNDSAIDEE